MRIFFFTRKEAIPSTNVNPILSVAPPQEYREFKDCFNLDKFILGAMRDDGKMLIFLDDYHNIIDKVPVLNKQGKITAYKNEQVTVQSQIVLEGEDIERFIKLTEI